MAKQARIDAPGALHHVIIRGIERKAIFKTVVDHDNFLSRLESLLMQTAMKMVKKGANLLLTPFPFLPIPFRHCCGSLTEAWTNDTDATDSTEQTVR